MFAAEEEGLMVEVMPGPDDERGVVDEESDILETFDRIKSAELLPMASLEYLMLVYSRVLFWKKIVIFYSVFLIPLSVFPTYFQKEISLDII